MKRITITFGKALLLTLAIVALTLWVNRGNEVSPPIHPLPPELIDKDGDSYTPNTGDCDEENPAIHPNANEVDEDNTDSDCDGIDDFQGFRTLTITENKVTPDLPIEGPARNVIKKLDGKELIVPQQLAEAKIELTIAYEDTRYPASVPTQLAAGIYIETDAYSPEDPAKDYWEYFAKIGTAFKRTNSGCSGQLQNTVYVLRKNEGKEATLPIIDLSKILLSPTIDSGKILDNAEWPCDKVKTIDLLELINTAARNKKNVKIGFYTTAPFDGKIVSAKLIYKGKEISEVPLN